MDVPFPARRAMQDAIWKECIAPADNELTTWSDSCLVAEIAAKALTRAGWKVVPLDEPAYATTCTECGDCPPSCECDCHRPARLPKRRA